MKKTFMLAVAAVAISLSTGCISLPNGPTLSALNFGTKSGEYYNPSVRATRVGSATVKSVLFVALPDGDATVVAAMKNGGITKINRIERYTVSYMGLYSEYTTIVYGE